MKIAVPNLSLVLLVGISGSGKSSFAARHFGPTETLSSDAFRAMVSDDGNDQGATSDAFEALDLVAAKRLARGLLTVVDATNVQPEARRTLIALARRHHVLAVAIVLNLPREVCAARNAARPDRDFGPHVLRRQNDQLRRSLKGLRREGFHRVYVLSDPEEVEAATVERIPVWNDRRQDTGPFDIIGDVHGCHAELTALLGDLGYEVAADGTDAGHPEGRRALFLGDLVDRGPASPAVLRLVMGMVEHAHAICLPGNHEVKLRRALRGENVTRSHGLDRTLEQLAAEPPEFSMEVSGWIDKLVAHFVLDGGRIVVAHAGLPEAMHGRSSAAVRSFALYGDTTGETDEFGLPIRYPWADDYRGEAAVVYGHTPVPEATWINNTICLDTGCVFGGRLTALRWPERELVSVPANTTYYEPTRPLDPTTTAGVRDGDELDLADVTGRRIVTTRLSHPVTVREDNAAAALEVMSRFAVDPRWLVYLPPTMAPPATSARPGLLEHPDESLAAFRNAGSRTVICEEKHMGSRAVLVVARNAAAASTRFGIDAGAGGAVFTRTGRRFFPDSDTTTAVLERVTSAVTAAGLWDELETDWLVLDTEILPWSAKAVDLIRHQYAAVGAAAEADLAAEVDVLTAAAARSVAGTTGLLTGAEARASLVSGYRDVYRRYSWPVDGLAGLAVAPFQVLATEGRVRALDDHRWHLGVADRLAQADPDLIRPTRAVTVDLGDEASVVASVDWWHQLTEAGGEGMVVKPLDVDYSTAGRLPPPGIKCRGREYLRIIYGPEYTAEPNLARLRGRSLAHKRSMAEREFALGIEGLERFVAGAPLRRVHECVFAVLALESEPVDPRL